MYERLHMGPRSATTETMTGTIKKQGVEAYCADFGRVRTSGSANGVGAALKPKGCEGVQLSPG